ncbi:adenosine deaminase-like [Babylonia areolata]|uniref:adenosine deaminase-like n=1 Tax=Babylonia areolata TaxID=304850 RepID=UPI003FD0E9AC
MRGYGVHGCVFDDRKQDLELPVKNVEDLKKQVCVYKADDLTSALENFFIFAPSFAGYHEGVHRIALEFCEDAARQGVCYAELRYSPHFLSNSLHVRTYARDSGGGYTPRDVVRSVNQALQEGERRYGVKVNTILCCIRHIPEWSAEVVELVTEFSEQGVVAMDIAGPEYGDIVTATDQSLHLAAFQEAKRRGIRCTAHAGEVGPPEVVRMAVDDYRVERVGHGYRSLEDPVLYRRLLDAGLHFETCPRSSLATKGWQHHGHDSPHPIVSMARDGANLSISSDDPSLFDTTLTNDYICVLNLGIGKELLIKSIFNAVRASFASDATKEELLSKLTTVYGPQPQ